MILKIVLSFVVLFIVTVIVALAVGMKRFNSFAQEETDQFLLSAPAHTPTLVTQDAIKNLPDPIKRYIEYSGIVGKPLSSVAHIQQTGRMRLLPDQPWMPFTARQYFTVDKPGFIWDATVKPLGLPLFRGLDTFKDTHGHMLISIAGLIPVVNAKGAEIDQGTVLRYLGEIGWLPSAYLDKHVSFETIDNNNVTVHFQNNGQDISGVLTIDDEGKQSKFEAMRYREVNGTYVLNKWKVITTGYGTFSGLRLPTDYRVIWETDQGDFEWLNMKITDIKDNY